MKGITKLICNNPDTFNRPRTYKYIRATITINRKQLYLGTARDNDTGKKKLKERIRLFKELCGVTSGEPIYISDKMLKKIQDKIKRRTKLK